jgi:hypothetical protein
MSFRRSGQPFRSAEHQRNSEAFMRRQVNASQNLRLLRGQASVDAQSAFMRAERVFSNLPDRVSRNLLKQLLRRSLKQLVTQYKSNWSSHSATHRSYGAQESVRKAVSRVIQSNGDTRGLRTKAGAGIRYKRRPRSYVAPIVDARAGWEVREQTARQIPQKMLLDDLALVIQTQFDDLVRKARLKARKS